MALTPQLPPTDFAELEKVESREEREKLYADEQIYKFNKPQGMRYTKGADSTEPPRSWQSLDVVLRSDVNAAAALPSRQLRRSRIFAALTVAAGILTVAGAAASAREGLNLGDIDPAGGVLLGGGLATVGFAITSGVFYGKSRAGYEKAVDIYNDSLGMRLGILDGRGNYVPPRGALVDADGNVVLDPGDLATPAREAPVDDASGEPAQPAAETVAAPAEPAPETAEPSTEATSEAVPESAPAEPTEPGADEGAEEGAEAGASAGAESAPADEPGVAVPPPTVAVRLSPRG